LPQTGNTFQFTQHTARLSARHSFKFGGDIRYQNSTKAYFNVNGEYIFGLAEPMIRGLPILANYLLGFQILFTGLANTEFVRSTSVFSLHKIAGD